MYIQSRLSGAIVLVVVAILFLSLYFLINTANPQLMQMQVAGCGVSAATLTVVRIAFRLRAVRRTNALMRRVRSAWL